MTSATSISGSPPSTTTFGARTAKERLESGARAQGELVKQLAESLDDLHRVTTIDPGSADAGDGDSGRGSRREEAE